VRSFAAGKGHGLRKARVKAGIRECGRGVEVFCRCRRVSGDSSCSSMLLRSARTMELMGARTSRAVSRLPLSPDGCDPPRVCHSVRCCPHMLALPMDPCTDLSLYRPQATRSPNGAAAPGTLRGKRRGMSLLNVECIMVHSLQEAGGLDSGGFDAVFASKGSSGICARRA
jgi:hypothetical protein